MGTFYVLSAVPPSVDTLLILVYKCIVQKYVYYRAICNHNVICIKPRQSNVKNYTIDYLKKYEI